MITSDIGCGAHVYVMCMLTFVAKIAQLKNPFHFSECLKALFGSFGDQKLDAF